MAKIEIKDDDDRHVPYLATNEWVGRIHESEKLVYVLAKFKEKYDAHYVL